MDENSFDADILTQRKASDKRHCKKTAGRHAIDAPAV